jgi:hypothetical protein
VAERHTAMLAPQLFIQQQSAWCSETVNLPLILVIR